MGYTTDFYGKFTLNKELDDELFSYLEKFSQSRRMKRDSEKLKALYGKDFGVEGEFFVDGESFNTSEKVPDTILNYNSSPSTQPGLWCQWTPSPDKKHIVWDGVEKFYRAKDWIIYIIDNFLKPNGYVLNGLVAAKGESSDDFWSIEIKDNEVIVTEDWSTIILKNGSNNDVPYCLKIGSHFFVTVNDYSTSNPAPSWSDFSDDERSYKMITFSSEEEARKQYESIRLRTVFQVSEHTPVEIKKLTDFFILLDDNVIVESLEGNEDYIQPNFSLVNYSYSEKDSYYVQPLS